MNAVAFYIHINVYVIFKMVKNWTALQWF